MVQLYGPNPAIPLEGRDFEIRARDGIPPYTFTYRVNEHPAEEVEQHSPLLEIEIPKGTSGDTLVIGVEDGAEETDEEIFFID